MTEHYFL
jgi:hypothetical protein